MRDLQQQLVCKSADDPLNLGEPVSRNRFQRGFLFLQRGVNFTLLLVVVGNARYKLFRQGGTKFMKS